MIEIHDLYTGYSRDKPLLSGFNYNFDNKIYGILGESGCGKTTLLRTVAGLIKPLSGEIIIDNNPVTKASKNEVYMMHQNYTSFDWLNCLDNILIAKKVKGHVEPEDADLVNSIFDDTYINAISDKFSATEVSNTNTVKVTEDNKKEIQDTEALLQGKASVTFIQNTAKFSDSAAASKELNKFIDIAKVLDGSIIEIAGNTDPNPESDPEDEYNQKLSLQRAEAVKNYFVMNGISNGRIVVVGNGSSNPVVDNDTDEHRAMNRRTDVSFKIIE